MNHHYAAIRPTRAEWAGTVIILAVSVLLWPLWLLAKRFRY